MKRRTRTWRYSAATVVSRVPVGGGGGAGGPGTGETPRGVSTKGQGRRCKQSGTVRRPLHPGPSHSKLTEPHGTGTSGRAAVALAGGRTGGGLGQRAMPRTQGAGRTRNKCSSVHLTGPLRPTADSRRDWLRDAHPLDCSAARSDHRYQETAPMGWVPCGWQPLATALPWDRAGACRAGVQHSSISHSPVSGSG